MIWELECQVLAIFSVRVSSLKRQSGDLKENKEAKDLV